MVMFAVLYWLVQVFPGKTIKTYLVKVIVKEVLLVKQAGEDTSIQMQGFLISSHSTAWGKISIIISI